MLLNTDGDGGWPQESEQKSITVKQPQDAWDGALRKEQPRPGILWYLKSAKPDTSRHKCLFPPAAIKVLVHFAEGSKHIKLM